MATDSAAFAAAGEVTIDPLDLAYMLIEHVSDGLDHPELWRDIPTFVASVPGLIDALFIAHCSTLLPKEGAHIVVLIALCRAAEGRLTDALAALDSVGTQFSQSPLVQGATFFVNGLADPNNPKYRLEGRVCTRPFEQMDVLDGTTHLCCASWLGTSVGDLGKSDWQEVWNSDTALKIRESVLDGSYRYCNKIACPAIHDGSLAHKAELAASSPEWRAIIEDRKLKLARGPQSVNLAYDQTCNLSCPSCRVAKIAADRPMRERFSELQDRAILPMLKDAETVMVTGSGDPFASKNFRALMERLSAGDYPALRFIVMTNGILLNAREWARFPALHNRVKLLRVSVDAATGPTHEKLRRGARWDVMLENMAFFGELQRDGLVDTFELTITVQRDNYREMGDLVSLAHRVGARSVYFGRVTNWGTYTDAEFADLAVCSHTHPEHAAFLAAMRDPRLRDPIVTLGDLTAFLPRDTAIAA